MAIHYQCRHCQQRIGSIHGQDADTDKLGFDSLTDEEQAEMIEYDSRGDLHVTTICENCEQTLADHPDYHEYESFLH
ncbi:anti-sigma-F factor Fin family protein [Alteribacter natronophilus]|uniref:anti-sigma-F factor Fin family protein n=1 Tax=Alteribacter natronophilus TaxID=2583810 RepID=UPI00110E08B7|nr:anti-sigma-F factor Fin family protein [Alteribacter natronophilus]TMW69955.1 anti-sigma-F factor Fin family protein [Alteribacter natronophilus]